MKSLSKMTIDEIPGVLGSELDLVAVDFPPDSMNQTDVRQRLNSYRAVMRRYMNAAEKKHNHKAPGIETARYLTAIIDSFVVHAFGLYLADIVGDADIAVAAIGGYGRCELNPYSDIDILCLVSGENAGVYDTKIGDMLQFLWDMNLDLGHSTRTAEECIGAVRDDSDFATSLLDARFVAGSAAMWSDNAEQFSAQFSGGAARRLLIEKIEERAVRLGTFQNTVQIQVPNVKECPGALRDIHVIRWITALAGRLNSSGYLPEREVAIFSAHLDFFLRLRHALHFLNGKRSDLLDHLILPDVAKNLGYSGNGIRSVENLMHDYYMNAAHIRYMTDRIRDEILDDLTQRDSGRYTALPNGIIVGEKDVRFDPGSESNLDMNPALLIALFSEAGARQLDISGCAAARIETFMDSHGKGLADDPELGKAFREMFNMRTGVSRAIRLMHKNGILTKIIPEFDEISWHYQFDFYHTYTTDEHSIRVVENLARMGTVDDPELADLADIIADVTAKGALYLAGLLHDVGKNKGRKHAPRGEKMAVKALKRLGFDRRTIDLVRFLISEHLLMSHVSQRRDMDDPDTIADFTARIGSTLRLRMLTLLTFADLMALSESALTDWKKALLHALYHKGQVLIEQGFEQQDVSSRKHSIDTIVSAFGESFSAETVRGHLDMLPEQYIRVTRRSSIKAHINGIGRMEKTGVWASFNTRGDVNYLTVITRDHPKVLSDICGTITSSDINIIGARIFTRNDDIVIDTFIVMNGNGESHIPAEMQKAFKKNIRRVIGGVETVDDLLMSHHRRWRRRKVNVVFSPPRMRIHNDISSLYTVIDVFAIDYTGLLYDITSVLASLGIDIHTAKIGTDEDQVADAFYIQNSQGKKIESEDSTLMLQDAIIGRLNKAYE